MPGGEIAFCAHRRTRQSYRLLQKELKALKAELAAAKKEALNGGGASAEAAAAMAAVGAAICGVTIGERGRIAGEEPRRLLRSVLDVPLLTSLVIAHFDETLEKHIQLSYFSRCSSATGAMLAGRRLERSSVPPRVKSACEMRVR